MDHMQWSRGLAFRPSASIPSWQPNRSGGAGLALNSASSVGLIQVGGGGLEQMRDFLFSQQKHWKSSIPCSLDYGNLCPECEGWDLYFELL